MKKNYQPVATSSKIRFDASDDQDSASEDEREVERELANVTFEELQRARSDGSEMNFRKRNAEKKARRENKNRPMEIDIRRPVIQVPKRVVRDPRFEPLCGKFDEEGFKRRYSFLYKDILPAERANLKKEVRKVKDPEVKNEMEDRLAHIDRVLKRTTTKRTEKHILAEHKKRERDAAKKGKQPYYLKKSEIRKQQLIEKYKELKESGKLESFIQKKRRKNAAKDHRYMPYRRPTEN